MTVDLDHLRRWVGREETAEDVVTPGLVARFRATLDPWLAGDDPVPLGLHWCLAPPAAPRGALGADGHAARGGFLPPVSLRNRMWAGGAVAFHRPLRVGATVRRDSRIAAVEAKTGRGGPLVFVSVDHRIVEDGADPGDGAAITERQDIVYRDAAPSAAASPPTHGAAPAGEGVFVADPVTLFRYSALTFNGHRIHYDHPHATVVEGYAGLVVHGPLQATVLMNAAARRTGTTAIHVSYRGLAPLMAGQAAAVAHEDGAVRLRRTDGTVTMEARHGSAADGAP